MTPKLDARAEKSQQALLRAGLELLNVNPDATLSDIANHAGVGRTTLYRQFETRDKLVHAIAVHCLQTFEEVTDPIERQAESVIDAIRLLFELAMPLTQELQFLMQLDQLADDDPAVAAISKEQTRQMFDLVELAKTEGSIDSSLPTSWVANLIDALFIAGWTQQQHEAYTSEKVASFAYASFCNGVCTA